MKAGKLASRDDRRRDSLYTDGMPDQNPLDRRTLFVAGGILLLFFGGLLVLLLAWLGGVAAHMNH